MMGKYLQYCWVKNGLYTYIAKKKKKLKCDFNIHLFFLLGSAILVNLTLRFCTFDKFLLNSSYLE